MKKELEKATLGGGCFWCTEAVYKELRGVAGIQPGYSGGNIKNPAYREVCTGRTGHAEVIQLEFDPEVVSYKEILEVFFMTHDPTTLNRQGNDVGTQYRSVIFYHNDKQKEIAEQVVHQFTEEKIYDNEIVTEIVPFENFYKAEDYHFDYFSRNADQPYCQYIIVPKLQKFRKIFRDSIKSEK